MAPILIRLTPMDREWVLRALRAVFGADELDDQRTLQQLLVGQSPGYTGPMTAEQAKEFADVIYASRGRGGKKWERAMLRLAERFRGEHTPAVKAKTVDRWVPARQAEAEPAPAKRACPQCGNAAEPMQVNRGTEWFCANCGATVLPEGEA